MKEVFGGGSIGLYGYQKKKSVQSRVVNACTPNRFSYALVW